MKNDSCKYAIVFGVIIMLAASSCQPENANHLLGNEISQQQINEQNQRFTQLIRKLEKEAGLDSNSIRPTFTDTNHRILSDEDWTQLEQRMRQEFQVIAHNSKETNVKNELNRIRNEQLAEAWSKCNNKRDSFAVALKFPDIVSFDAAGYEELRQLGLWPPKANDRKN